MKSEHPAHIETRAIHAGIEEYEYGSVVPPIYQTSTFKFKNVDHGARLFKGEEEGFIYTRMRNPTVEAMEKAIADLEGGYMALGCGSGMAAVHTVFAALLSAGDHVICSNAVYGPTTTLLGTIFKRFGVETDFVDTSDLQKIKSAVRKNTKIIYIETPGNPTLAMTDIQGAADIAHKNGASLVVDNTFMSPIQQRPFEFGADVILHSLTKFLNGHADVVGGVIIVKTKEQYGHFRKTLNQVGGVIDPFNSFLVHRGIKTLPIRMERHQKNSMRVAEFLENHPKIAWVRYPGLKSFPQADLAKKQMTGFGGMIVCEMKGGLESGKTLMNSLKVFQLAVSLGGVESLIQHPASMTHASMGKEQREKAQITDGLVRISVGLENVEDLIEDFKQALDKCDVSRTCETSV